MRTPSWVKRCVNSPTSSNCGTPEQLIQALVEEPDPDRLRDIARELRKPRTDGTRYAPHVKTLVHRLMSRPDEHIELDLVEGIARMIANAGEPFRDALLGEVRALGMGSRGSGRLLHEVATYGIVALPLLLDVACSALEESESTPGGVTYAMSGFNAVDACMRQDGFPLEEGSRLLLSRLPAASPQAANQISQRLGGAFDLELFGGHSLTVQRLVLDAIDAHVDPAGTTYSGMAPDPGCAAFYGVGGPAWVERLVGYLQSMWRAPVNAADLRFRLDALERAQTREVKLLIARSIHALPGDVTDDDTARGQEVVSALLADQDLMRTAEKALRVLRGEPEPMRAERRPRRGCATAVLGLALALVSVAVTAASVAAR